MPSSTGVRRFLPIYLLGALPVSVLTADVLSTSGYSLCSSNTEIQVQTLDASYNKNTKKITFDVAGSSASQQNVTLELVVSAYGKQVYTREFSPCDEGMTEMCPSKSGFTQSVVEGFC